jgi:hypothetical protein
LLSKLVSCSGVISKFVVEICSLVDKSLDSCVNVVSSSDIVESIDSDASASFSNAIVVDSDFSKSCSVADSDSVVSSGSAVVSSSIVDFI